MPGKQENRVRLLLVAILHICLAPKEKLKLSTFELMYERLIMPHIQKQGPLNPHELEQVQYALQIGETMRPLLPMDMGTSGSHRFKPSSFPTGRLSISRDMENWESSGPVYTKMGGTLPSSFNYSFCSKVTGSHAMDTYITLG